ncbi:MAG: hypothetical protein V7K21_15035 [Nostoc sp.]|uniref:hypothetical protein n=1 Tax=Nostoc sp. TaxID=1180 RepID=UPI002FF7D9C6
MFFHYLLLTNGRILDFKFWIWELLAELLVEKIQNIKMFGASEFQQENNSIIPNLKLNGKPVNLGIDQSKIQNCLTINKNYADRQRTRNPDAVFGRSN